MSDDDSEHLGADAWVFIAVADPSTEWPNPLSNVMATTDFYQHGVPTAKDFEHAIRDLSAAGLVTAAGISFALTANGQRLWDQVRAEPTHRHFVVARDALRRIDCVAHVPGWSLDEHTWEGALAVYSPQFALDLKRRREKGPSPRP